MTVMYLVELESDTVTVPERESSFPLLEVQLTVIDELETFETDIQERLSVTVGVPITLERETFFEPEVYVKLKLEGLTERGGGGEIVIGNELVADPNSGFTATKVTVCEPLAL